MTKKSPWQRPVDIVCFWKRRWMGWWPQNPKPEPMPTRAKKDNPHSYQQHLPTSRGKSKPIIKKISGFLVYRLPIYDLTYHEAQKYCQHHFCESHIFSTLGIWSLACVRSNHHAVVLTRIPLLLKKPLLTNLIGWVYYNHKNRFLPMRLDIYSTLSNLDKDGSVATNYCYTWQQKTEQHQKFLWRSVIISESYCQV